jgi:hypothetical protein
VYQDEFVNWLENNVNTNYPSGHSPLFYQLDNEPDYWAGTHANIQTGALTYADLMKKSLDAAAAIKAHSPDTKTFGPTMGGWYGQVALQGAPDGNGQNFIDFYLKSFADADASSGTRTLDVLDVHWYPEASSTSDPHGPGVDNDQTDAATVAARVQTTRSLWDPDYTENSWITKDAASGPIDLLDRLQKSIDSNYPGTRISITEYYYGGGDDISGALAEADALGAFAQKNLFAASLWSLTSGGGTDSYIHAAMSLFLTHFGDTSLDADSSNKDQASVWASRFSTDADQLAVVAINKTTGALNAKVTLSYARPLGTATAYVLTAGSTTPAQKSVTVSSTNAFLYAMPAMSVSLILLTK